MIKDIPLPVDFHYRAVVVPPAVGHDAVPVRIFQDLPSVEADIAPVAETFQRPVAPAVTQEPVAVLMDPQFRHRIRHTL